MALGDRYLATVEVTETDHEQYRWEGSAVPLYRDEIKSLELLPPKPATEPLKPKTVTVYDSTDLSDLIERSLGLDYDLVYHLECGNGELTYVDAPRADPSATERVKAWADRPNKSRVPERDEGLEMEDVFAELVNRGLLEEPPAGESTITIHVWW